MHKILVNVMREEIRMAVIDEEGQLVDFVLERTDESHMANHMYKGTVKNVLMVCKRPLLILGALKMRT